MHDRKSDYLPTDPIYIMSERYILSNRSQCEREDQCQIASGAMELLQIIRSELTFLFSFFLSDLDAKEAKISAGRNEKPASLSPFSV